MRGTHDMGGVRGFGPVPRHEDHRFDAAWERRAFGLNMGTLGVGLYNVDENRYARERMAPGAYLTSSYFEQLLAAVETCLVEGGVLSLTEIDDRTDRFLADPDAEVDRAVSDDVEAAVLARLSAGISRQRRAEGTPRFAVGDRVVARRGNPAGHSRLPTYVQGCRGRVAALRGTYVLPDTNAHGLGEQPEPLYAVAFPATELWGPDADARASTSVDLWERYLGPAGP